tara:strand:+ start:12043 stop:12384 length:342 start_codon:yes stop_codon:yes gene_type:complete
MPYLPSTTNYKWLRKIKKDYNKSYSNPKYAKLYNTSRWRKMRDNYIMQNPICIICKKNNRIRKADVVDHIIEVADGGNMWELSNLQSLCDPCHRSKTSKAVHRRYNKKRNNNN